MPKRTGNSSVNSSIRQQTKANDEGLGRLLETQQASLGELSSIRQLLDLSKQHEQLKKNENGGIDQTKIQDLMLIVAEQQLHGSRKYWKTQEEFEEEWRKEAKDIAEMAKGMKSFKTIGEKFKDKIEGVKDKFGIANGGLKKTVLGAMNVGGIFNKTLERDEFVKKQRALGSTSSTKELKADYEGARKASHAIKKNEKALDKLKALTGISDEDTLKAHSPAAAKLFATRQSETENLSKFDRGARQFSPDLKNAKLAGLLPKSPTATAAEAMQGAETAEESQRAQESEIGILKQIEENTRAGAEGKAAEAKPEKVKGDSFLDMITGFLGEGFMTALKAMFNPKAILKALGKVFAIGMIVGALFEGIMDGFKEFQESGDIGKALIAGLAGIVDFLTFGLFDKEKVKAVIGDMAAWIGDHIVKPIGEFFTAMKDSFLSFIEGIGIPEIKFKVPVIGKEVSIGPFYPFKSDGSGSKPEAAAPTTGNIVEQKSADNANSAASPGVKNNTSVVNAPVTNNSNTTQVIRSPIRNQESSVNKYTANRYA
jgi:hypothetical protein